MKQVIIMRTDLNMRKGKMIVQGAHASMLFMFHDGDLSVANRWYRDGMKKIGVRVDTITELLILWEQARKAGLRAHIVTDAGHTEFHGEPTMTCLAIGPNDEEAVDKITGHLKLL